MSSTVGLATLLLVVLLFGLQSLNQARADVGVTYVDGTSGQDISTCGTTIVPCQTIGYALSLASEGDTIYVAQGVYTENLTISISVTLEGGYEPLSWTRDTSLYETIIYGNQAGHVVIFCADSDGAILEGFTLAGGNAADGGGVYLDAVSPTIRMNTIKENTVIHQGGGIKCDRCSAIIENNVIAGNNAGEDGGGISCSYGSPLIKNNIISENTANVAGEALGGGIHLYHASPTIIGNTIAQNTAVPDNGGGIACDPYSSPVIENNTIRENTASTGGGIYADTYASPRIISNTIIGNEATGEATGTGGGIFTWNNVSAIISGNMISENRAEGGGGVACVGTSSCTIVNNIIVMNMSVGNGAAVGITFDSSSTIVNNTIADNMSGEGGAIICEHNSVALITNTIIWDNNGDIDIEIIDDVGETSSVTVTYSDIEQGWIGEGNISTDPLFVNQSHGDYHLRFGSPCIDNGIDTGLGKDFDGDFRAFDGDGDGIVEYDIGADEWVGTIRRVYLPLALKNS